GQRKMTPPCRASQYFLPKSSRLHRKQWCSKTAWTARDGWNTQKTMTWVTPQVVYERWTRQSLSTASPGWSLSCVYGSRVHAEKVLDTRSLLDLSLFRQFTGFGGRFHWSSRMRHRRRPRV